jgi:8-oxo-dGTP pyrophosphatase MutT (NUDIX family)
MLVPTRVEQFAQELSHWNFSTNADQRELYREYRDLIAADDQSLDRARLQGHFTASALLVDPMRAQVMLVMHPRVKRWLQMGGHIESTDRSFRDAALRESQEESGYAHSEVGEFPVQLDRHDVVCKSPTGEVIHSVHWDVQFLALLDSGQVRQITEEAQTRWWGFDESVPGIDHSVERLIGAARQILE